MITALTFIAMFAMAMRISVASDTWWHLRAGEWMLQNGQLLTTDPFSLTRQGEPWIYPGWLAQILMIAIYRGVGLPGLNLLTAAAVLLAFAFLWKTMDEPPLLKAFALVLGATVSAVYWSARPQILSFAMAGVFYWSLQRAQRLGPRALWLPPVLMALWVNLHGGFAIGFILLAIELLAATLDRFLPGRLRLTEAEAGLLQPRHVLAALGLCLIAVMFNPHGARMLTYPYQTVSIGTLRDYIQEWQSPNFHSVELLPFLLMLLLSGGVLAVSPVRPSWRALFTVGAFAAMALSAARNVALFGLLATPALARYAHASLAGRLPPAGDQRQLPQRLARIVNLMLVSLLAAAAALKSVEPMRATTNQAAVERSAPTGAVEYLSEHRPPGPLFNSYNWGSYLMWALHPDYLTFVDGRTDLFDDEILDQYIAIWRADPGWESLLPRWGIRLALVEPNAPIALQLQVAGWEALYRDAQSVLLTDD